MLYPGVKELLQTLPPYRWTVVTPASETIEDIKMRRMMGFMVVTFVVPAVVFGIALRLLVPSV